MDQRHPQNPPAKDRVTVAPASAAQRLWLLLKVIQMRLRFIAVFVLAALVVAYWERIDAWYDAWTRPAVTAQAGQEYFCPMHPAVVRTTPAHCPICGMPLSLRAEGSGAVGPAPAESLARIQLTPLKLALGQVATSPVQPMLLSRELRQYGEVEQDRTRVVDIAARVRGRIDDLLVNYDGQPVTTGQVLLQLYSPELYRAQQEYLIALTDDQDRTRNRELLKPAPGGTLVDAARRRLETYGFSAEQIKELERTGTPVMITPIRSPITGYVMQMNAHKGHYVEEGYDIYTLGDLSKVWLQIRLFEDQIADVHVGSAVEVRTTAFPDETFIGRVAFLAPQVDATTRTLAARVEVDNPDQQLRPGMYAEAIIRSPAGRVEDLEPKSAAGGSVAAHDAGQGPVPTSAPASAPAVAAGPRVPRALLDAYLRLTEALAADRLDPDAVHLLNVSALGLKDPALAELRQAINVLHGVSGIEPTRDALVRVSTALVAALRASGQLGEFVLVNCSMKPGDWIQRAEPIANPYYGSGMLRCGDILQAAGAPSAAAPASAPAGAVPGAVADLTPLVGYYCPLTPDRLYPSKESCPVDGAPMLHARLTPVLAVPESAVVHTGRRTFVYVQADPASAGAGVFDLREVRLAPRARGPEGLFYPVLSGLRAGERVVTRGTFAVDAETRLGGAYPTAN